LISPVGGGRLAQAVSASTHPHTDACRTERNCAKLGCMGSVPRGIRGHCHHPWTDSQRSIAGIGGSYMDIGYFLKLMTEKNASDMFLTTGAPVYIKVEGKLYPLGNTGLPTGMVK